MSDELVWPAYESRDEELQELMNYFKFSYQSQSGYKGTGLFEIKDEDSKMFYRMISTDPISGVEVFEFDSLQSVSELGKHVDFHVTLPYQTFHDVFWGLAHPRALVIGGGCTVKNWAYTHAMQFGLSFDMSSDCWRRFYDSDLSLKQMNDNLNEIQNNNIFLNRRFGPKLPLSANDTNFMYEWKPNAMINSNSDFNDNYNNYNNNNDNSSDINTFGTQIGQQQMILFNDFVQTAKLKADMITECVHRVLHRKSLFDHEFLLNLL